MATAGVPVARDDTRVTATTQLETAAGRDRGARMGHEAGMGHSLERLAALLAER